MIRWLLQLSDAVRDRCRRRYWPPDQATGRRGEDLAHRYLERRGMTVVARNYARRAGVQWERVRFDLVSVVFSHPPSISHSEDVFRPDRTL